MMSRAGGRPLADAIDDLLPQTQCTRCGFDGCRPYAEALAAGATEINRCPPGGRPVIDALAALLGVPSRLLDPECGNEEAPRVALVDEAACIGCAKCLDVCPTDAIAGARKWMHAVIAGDCSGCELCLPACPVDCILLVPAPGEVRAPLDGPAIARRARHFGRLYASRMARLRRDEQRRSGALEAALAAGWKSPRGAPP